MSLATAAVETRAVTVQQLRTGLFVHLDLGWLDHPFPTNRFLIRNEEQIEKLRGLRLRTVTIVPEKCDPAALASLDERAVGAIPEVALAAAPSTPSQDATGPVVAAPRETAPVDAVRERHRALLQSQHSSMERSQKLHSKAVEGWQMVMRDAITQPSAAAEAAVGLAGQFMTEMQSAEDTTIRVLSEAAGTGHSQHAVNVTVLSLMLGQKMGLASEDLDGLTVGALMHDLGKLQMPEAGRDRSNDPGAAIKACRDHIAYGVRLGMSMGLSPVALRVIAQHHELFDGSGLPQGLKGEEITLPSRIVALANLYDELCNPVGSTMGRTPHEAQALLYAQKRQQIDPAVLAAFIKLMGVYPPGSVVQLTDERFALVVSTHPQQPLKPCVLIHDPAVPREEALLVDLTRTPKLGVKRSLHPQHLPRATMDYLSPGKRVHYYFSQGLEAVGGDISL